MTGPGQDKTRCDQWDADQRFPNKQDAYGSERMREVMDATICCASVRCFVVRKKAGELAMNLFMCPSNFY